MDKKLSGGQRSQLFAVFTPMLLKCDTLNDDELKTLYEIGEDLGVDVDAEIKRINGNRGANPFALLSEPVSNIQIQNKINEVK